MRLNVIYIIFFCGLCINSNAQIRRDAVWCFGDSVMIDFNQSPPEISNCAIRTRGTACSITDTLGNILFYCQSNHRLPQSTNLKMGAVFNKANQIMENGDSLIAEGWYHEMQIIPDPANSLRYYIFHIGTSTFHEIYYSIIDLSFNSGFGKITQKNILLKDFNGDYTTDGLTSIKHGNGRDWWILFKTFFNVNDTIHRYLISDLGISQEMVQRVGTIPNSGIVRFFFNHSGTKMVLVSVSGLLEYYDFDRCTGLLSNRIQINPETLVPADYFWSAAFSPNDSILYITVLDTTSYLYQYNLTAGNISSSRTLIYSFNFPYYGTGDLRTAIDGKIYWSICYYDGLNNNFPFPDTLYNSINTNLSVINEPNQAGMACDLQPFSFNLGGFRTYYGLGVNANYDLGSLPGSICDTLTNGLNEINNQTEISLYPNPSHFNSTLHANGLRGNFLKLNIYDSMGKLIDKFSQRNIHEEVEVFIPVENYQPGIYLLELITENEYRRIKLIVE